MEINWIIVVAQIINFLILVWLLQRLLYRPVIKAIDDRRIKIEQQRTEAENVRQTAEKEAATYRARQKALDKQRDALMSEAHGNADKTYKKLLTEVRQNVLIQKNEWLEDLATEKQDFLESVRDETIETFSQLADRIFKDLANEKLEDQIARHFIRMLEELPPDDLAGIKTATGENSKKVTIYSTYPLSEQRRHDITKAVHQIIMKDIKLVFEETDKLICGLEMRIGGYVIRWSLDSFLEDMNTELNHQLETSLLKVNKEAAE